MSRSNTLQQLVDFCTRNTLVDKNNQTGTCIWNELSKCNILSREDPLFGSVDSRAVQYWFEQAWNQDKSQLLESVNKHLSNKTYLVGERLTIADIAVYTGLYSTVQQMLSQPIAYADTLRWFDLLQNTLPQSQSLEKVEMDFTKLRIGTSAAAAGATEKEEKTTSQQKKKEKSSSTKNIESEGKKESVDEEDISRLDIRVGKILSAKRHPDADTLYVEEIDVGEASARTVCSGLVKFIPDPEQLLGYCIVVCNLKPVTMRGIKSEAMILCATSPDGTKVELVQPPQGVQIGERVKFPGHDGIADSVLNPKKKIFEKIQPHFATTEDCIATWKGIPFTTSQGPCKVASIRGGTIR